VAAINYVLIKTSVEKALDTFAAVQHVNIA